MTPDEKRLLIDLCRCVDLVAWQVRDLRRGQPEAVEELTQVIENLQVLRRVLRPEK